MKFSDEFSDTFKPTTQFEFLPDLQLQYSIPVTLLGLS